MALAVLIFSEGHWPLAIMAFTMWALKASNTYFVRDVELLDQAKLHEHSHGGFVRVVVR